MIEAEASAACAGLHDAVEKGYLETMTFGLSRDKEGKELVEQFHYNFAYEGNAFTMTDSFGTNVDVPLSQSSQVRTLNWRCGNSQICRRMSTCRDW